MVLVRKFSVFLPKNIRLIQGYTVRDAPNISAYMPPDAFIERGKDTYLFQWLCVATV